VVPERGDPRTKTGRFIVIFWLLERSEAGVSICGRGGISDGLSYVQKKFALFDLAYFVTISLIFFTQRSGLVS
jgi:hypothetical protein